MAAIAATTVRPATVEKPGKEVATQTEAVETISADKIMIGQPKLQPDVLSSFIDYICKVISILGSTGTDQALENLKRFGEGLTQPLST